MALITSLFKDLYIILNLNKSKFAKKRQLPKQDTHAKLVE